ncbi:hypothetical protein MTO96_016548 [Rhipicephalus appendiculatus]
MMPGQNAFESVERGEIRQRVTGPKALKGVLDLIRWTEEQFKKVILLLWGKDLVFLTSSEVDISDGQAFGQRPLTFPRQVVSGCAYPDITDYVPLPTDVKLRMKEILDHCPGKTVGSVIINGHPIVRQHIADYISSRDGIDVNPAGNLDYEWRVSWSFRE